MISTTYVASTFNRHPRCVLAAVIWIFSCSEIAGASEVEAIDDRPAPTLLQLKDISGKKFRLDELAGRIVVVNFWATWCPPCIREFPSLERFRQETQDLGVEVLAVNVGESADRVRRFRRLPAGGIRVLLDPSGTEAKAWGAVIYPTSFVIAPSGRLAYRIVGEFDWDDDALRQSVRDMSSSFAAQ